MLPVACMSERVGCSGWVGYVEFTSSFYIKRGTAPCIAARRFPETPQLLNGSSAKPVTPASGAAPATESTPTFDPSTDPTTQEMMNACATQCTDKNGDKCLNSAKHCFQEGGDEKTEILCAIKLGCQATNNHIGDALKVT